MQQPSVGRIVHYVSYGTPGGEFDRECRAAIVTEVLPQPQEDADTPPPGPVVGLAVFNPGGTFFHRCPYHGSERNGAWNHPGGTWHWPERIEG